MPLGFKVAMHRGHLVAGVLPESCDPAEQADRHQDEREDDPLRDWRSFDGPEECRERECWLLALGRGVQQDCAVAACRYELGGFSFPARPV